MTGRFALIIGNSDYEDQTLAQLKTPDVDVHTLALALSDPVIGGFDDVQELVNKDGDTVRRTISKFYLQKKSDDLLLLYFSGHGVLDSQGRLFLAIKDTQRELLKATAIPASFISDDMDSCRSKRQILILDCCHSGAFARGTKGDSPAVTQSTFEGNGFGRVVLTASDSTQYALEGDQVIQQASLSLFTHYLLEGLTTGAADSARDGWITLDEWYDYAYDHVVSETPEQTPRKWVYNQQGELVVARNPKPIIPAFEDLPAELRLAIESPYVGVRAEAVDELSRVLRSGNPKQTLAAQDALQKLADHDDSRRIINAAAEILADYLQTHKPGPAIATVESVPVIVESALPIIPASENAVTGIQPVFESGTVEAAPAENRSNAPPRTIPTRRAERQNSKALKRFLPVIPVLILCSLCVCGLGAYRGLVLPYLASQSQIGGYTGNQVGTFAVNTTPYVIAVPTKEQSTSTEIPADTTTEVAIVPITAITETPIPPEMPQQTQQSTNRAWMGITGSTLDPEIAKAMKLPDDQTGVLIAEVVSGGPADQAGLLGSNTQIDLNGQSVLIGGDVITVINGQSVTTIDKLGTIIKEHQPGDQIFLTILRYRQKILIYLKLGEWPANQP